jgi:hypothetical protein
MTVLKIAFAAACIATSASAAFAGGLSPADPQFVTSQGKTDSYAGSGSQISDTARPTVQLAPMTDAERVNVNHQFTGG